MDTKPSSVATPGQTLDQQAKKLSKKQRREQRLQEQGKLDPAGKPFAAPTAAAAAAASGKTPAKTPAAAAASESQGTQKSKAELKAERRAKQEADRQRKAKEAGGGHGGSTGAPSGGSSGVTLHTKIRASKSTSSDGPVSSLSKKEPPRVSDALKQDDPKVQKRRAKKLERHQIPQRAEIERKVSLFSHLDQYERQVSITRGLSFASGGIHPAVMRLGLQYAEGIICGANARCIAMLHAFKQVIADYTTPPQKELSRDLESKIKPYISFLNVCRPKSVSMGNAIKYVKLQISQIPQDMADTKAKEHLYQCIDSYVNKIILAAVAISKDAIKKIKNGDVILIYTCSSLIYKVLCDAHEAGKTFRVIVADSRPKSEGIEAVRRLMKHGIKCTYILISAISYMMQEVSKVFLGAHALLANGYVMSRVGSSIIAMVAKAYNVPVLVCCETYKFSERVQTDSFVFNELGDPDDLVKIRKPTQYLKDWRNIQSLTILNLVYDVTPPDFISMVITEIGMLPCTSVPVVLRVKNVET
ncbi:translation initiation factor eIF-2B subunit delta-like [Asterias rubens]|uniref:translation initiation factor eIF-2B subunit delta-like n=1 Tax=Asterias rubens TaxID=7604 RepID=UPI0014554BFF|nr:translation initiation factor eIF-2B subunit delta-like [Asterias rubens]XP_033646622.1 translation initiation factor eIF-2B subunit delta-like [Asterias rubens]